MNLFANQVLRYYGDIYDESDVWVFVDANLITKEEAEAIISGSIDGGAQDETVD